MNMRTVFVAAAAVLMMQATGLAQSRLMRGTAERSGYHFFFDTLVEPGEPDVQGIGGGIINGKQMHRVMVDSRNRAYFGYDVTMEPLPERDTYRVTFSRLSIAREDLRSLGEDVPRYAQLPDPGWGGPAVRTLHAGDVLTLDLLTNHSTGQKIVDYVTVQATANPPQKLGPLPWNEVREPGTPRDFQARDAWIDLDIKSLTIDGKAMPKGGVTAAVPYMAFPDYGRFVLSLAPRPEVGFQPAGIVRGSSLNFSIDGHAVEILSSRRIAPGSGPFNLYVLHQTDWDGRNPTMAFALGGVDPERLPRTTAGQTRTSSSRPEFCSQDPKGEYSRGAVLLVGGLRYACANVRNSEWQPDGVAWVRVDLVGNDMILFSRPRSTSGLCERNPGGQYNPGAVLNLNGQVARCATVFDASFKPAGVVWIDVRSLRGDDFVLRIH